MDTINTKNDPCPFCAGAAAAVTLDHIPSKSMYFGQRPSGFEAYACQECNHHTRKMELQLACVGATARHLGDKSNERWRKFYDVACRGMGTYPAELAEYMAARNAAEIGCDMVEDPRFASYRYALDTYMGKIGAAIYRRQFDEVLPASGGVFAFTRTLYDDANDGSDTLRELFPADRSAWRFNRQGNSKNSATGEHIFEHIPGMRNSENGINTVKVDVELFGWIRAILVATNDVSDGRLSPFLAICQPVKPPFRDPQFRYQFLVQGN